MDLQTNGGSRIRQSVAARRAGAGVIAVLALTLCSLLLAPAMASAAGTGSIEGTVTDASTTNPIKGVEVCAYKAEGEEFEEHCEVTNANGEYTISGLQPDEYKVEFWAPSGVLNYITQYYNDQSTFAAANEVTVNSGTTTPNIDAAMHEGGQIKGTVTDAVSHAPIGEVLVCAESTNFGRCAFSKANGEYTISGLLAPILHEETAPRLTRGAVSSV